MNALSINQPDLGERVYDVVRDRIMTSKLAPGAQITVTGIARELGISLTPVRDAFNRLAAERIISEVPRRGYHITKLDAQEAADLLEARLILELGAVNLGIERITTDQLRRLEELVVEMEELRPHSYLEYSKRDYLFHQTLVATANNRELLHLHGTLGIHVHAHRQMLRTRPDDKGTQALAEHRAILKALQGNNRRAARAAIERHLRRTAQTLAANSCLSKPSGQSTRRRAACDATS